MKRAFTKQKSVRHAVPSPSANESSSRSSGKRPLFVVLLLLAALAVAAFALLNVSAEAPPEPMKEVWIPAGEFTMGDEEFDDARPLHTVYVDGFWMDETEVTNEQFAEFVRQTGYVTLAEKPFAGAPPGAGVFDGSKCPLGEACRDCRNWWDYREGACWRHPEGPGSDLRGREKHPVVHIAWEDALAYARWAGKRLPTEAEWERAARGGLEGKRYYWGDELHPNGKWPANIWQGTFPRTNTAEDGFTGTAPVKSFPPNGYGLYDMAGNVWEWCADWYRPNSYAASPKDNPQGPESSIDPDGAGEPKRVQRGGSFLCSDRYCVRYRAGARGQGEPKTGLSHTGFRCVRSGH
jgi:formylglycine-generating enzyme required for sulfatase activity